MRFLNFLVFCFLISGTAFAGFEKSIVLPFIPYIGVGGETYSNDRSVTTQTQKVPLPKMESEYRKVATFVYGSRQDYLGKRELDYIKMLADKLSKNQNLYVLIRTYYVPDMDDFDTTLPTYRLASIVDPLTDLGVLERQIRTDVVTKRRPLFSPHRVEIFVK